MEKVYRTAIILDNLHTKITEEERAQDASMAECLAAASASAQHGFGKFFKAQFWKNVHDVINSSERSDTLVFNCYLCHVRFLLTCYVCSTKIGENSDISKCFENFVSQALGVLTRIYAAELRLKIKI